MAGDHASILDGDAFDAEWPLWGTTVLPSPAVAPRVWHRHCEGDPGAPVDEGYRHRFDECRSTLTIWTDKATGAPAGITCPDCGAGQVCSVGQDHPATRLTARGLRCETHR
jgi:hypothetical protein